MNDILSKKLEISTDKGREKIWWDKQNGIARNVMIGHVDDKSATWIYDNVVALTNATRLKNINWLVDISKLNTATRKARNIMKQMDQLDNINKIAFVGGNAIGRIITNFIISAAGKETIKHFSIEDEQNAITWLKQH